MFKFRSGVSFSKTELENPSSKSDTELGSTSFMGKFDKPSLRSRFGSVIEFANETKPRASRKGRHQYIVTSCGDSKDPRYFKLSLDFRS